MLAQDAPPPIGGVSAIALLLIASFAIDRITHGTLFALSFVPAWRKRVPIPSLEQDAEARGVAERRHKMGYFLIAGILGVVVLAWFADVRLLRALLGFDVNPVWDVIVTGLTLVAGADSVSALVKAAGGPEAKRSDSQPIEVKGRLILERESEESIGE